MFGTNSASHFKSSLRCKLVDCMNYRNFVDASFNQRYKNKKACS